MKFILIVAYVTSLTGGGTPAVTMQEFDTQKACDNAGQVAVKLAKKLPGEGRNITWECVLKSL